jgi:hypothetical protein
MHGSLRRHQSHGAPPVQPNLTPDFEGMANDSVGCAGVTEVPEQHQAGCAEMEAVQRPDRSERQAEHVHRINQVADVGQDDVPQAVPRPYRFSCWERRLMSAELRTYGRLRLGSASQHCLSGLGRSNIAA